MAEAAGRRGDCRGLDLAGEEGEQSVKRAPSGERGEAGQVRGPDGLNPYFV